MATSTVLNLRRADLDWLRVLGVLLLVPFHVALIHVLDPHAVMYFRDHEHSPVLAWWAGFVHYWHMPTLFMVSGAASYYALARRTALDFLQERMRRLLLPLVFAMATYLPLTIYFQHRARMSPGQGWLKYFEVDMNNLDGMTGTWTPAHLWFVLFLLVFAILFVQMFVWLRSERGQVLILSLERTVFSPAGVLLLGIPLILAGATGILGDKNPIFYGLLYFFGFLYAASSGFQFAVRRVTWVAVCLGVIEVMVNSAWPVSALTEWSPPWIAAGVAYLMGRWFLTLAVFGLASRYLNRPNTWISKANTWAMPFYLLHMTFCVLAGYLLSKSGFAIPLKFAASVLLATSMTAAALAVAARSPISRVLLGLPAS